MTAATHTLFGALWAGVPIVYSVAGRRWALPVSGGHAYFALAGLAGSLAGALGPDIDIARSRNGRKLRKMFNIGILLLLLVLAAGLFLYLRADGERFRSILVPFLIVLAIFVAGRVVIGTFRHRGITHSLLSLLFVALPAAYILYFAPANAATSLLFSLSAGFALGWASHLVADTFNGKGASWLYPISSARIHVANLDTGTWHEKLFMLGSLAVFVSLYVWILTKAT
jgi:membrane-bound metal-dependent hydrolase YbcI (DUF457 family)